MSIIAAGIAAPAFSLMREDGSRFTQDDLLGTRTIFVFYPAAFSDVCTDQFQIYEEALGEIAEHGAVMYGVSCDSYVSQAAFREKLGVTIPQLSDFEPKGAMSKAFGAYFEQAGISNRALVITGPDGVVTWSWAGEHPGVLPGINIVMDGLAASAAA